ncbi:MAG TPA: tyrosine-type recombinase/integrase [Streptosporangiaceae bacterium]|nr:tyrosine-type recombinase/integrase [Streptosporangiaceae bacterium]
MTRLPEPRRDPKTGRWSARYAAPADADGKRRQPRVYGKTRRECVENLTAALTQVQTGVWCSRRATVGEHLEAWLEWRRASLKERTWCSYRDAVALYWRPALGHIRLADLRSADIMTAVAAIRRVNRDEAGPDELLRRLLAARATVHGERLSSVPLSESTIRRLYAPLRAALADANLPADPCRGVRLGKVRKHKPLLWTQARIDEYLRTGCRPAKVMVWDASQCGAFLDYIAADRLYPLYHLIAHYGLRRSEACKLAWADYDSRHLHIRESGGDETKTESSERVVTVDAGTDRVLTAWRKTQLAERMRYGAAWQDSGRMFTAENGAALRVESISERFDRLVAKSGLPPVTLHGLRHGAASMLLAAGVPLKVTSEILGHASSAFTADVYTSVSEELAESAASAIGAFIPRATRVPEAGSGEH